MAEIIARYADGRLLVHEERVMAGQIGSGGFSSGYPGTRIGLLRVVEQVISVDTKLSGYPDAHIAAPLSDVTIGSGNLDTIKVVLRRADIRGPLSGLYLESGFASIGALSGLVCSGLPLGGRLLSGKTSGRLTIIANVIGY